MADFTVNGSAVDTRELEALEKAVKAVRAKAIPYAIRNTLNDVAFVCRASSLKRIEGTFILRNRYTRAGLRVDKAQGVAIENMESVTGHAAPYMAEQETGFTRRAKGKHGIPIATTTASGEGQNAKVRRRPVRRPNYQKAIDLAATPEFPTQAQTIAVAIAMTRRKGKRFVFLPFIRHKGIYKITGGATRRRARISLVWALDAKSKQIPPHRWLEPATTEASREIPPLYEKRLRSELDQAMAHVHKAT